MDLIAIQPNLLVNVDHITTVKISESNGASQVMVTVGNKNHVLEVSLDQFLRQMKEAGTNLNEQFWSV